MAPAVSNPSTSYSTLQSKPVGTSQEFAHVQFVFPKIILHFVLNAAPPAFLWPQSIRVSFAINSSSFLQLSTTFWFQFLINPISVFLISGGILGADMHAMLRITRKSSTWIRAASTTMPAKLGAMEKVMRLR